jgi:hypothetical protein
LECGGGNSEVGSGNAEVGNGKLKCGMWKAEKMEGERLRRWEGEKGSQKAVI